MLSSVRKLKTSFTKYTRRITSKDLFHDSKKKPLSDAKVVEKSANENITSQSAKSSALTSILKSLTNEKTQNHVCPGH